MSTGIKYYPESSYVSISFAWIKDRDSKAETLKPTSNSVILGSFMTFPCTTELTQPYEPWTWGLFPHGGGVDGELMTILEAMSHVRRFHRSQRCGCQGVNIQDLATMETCDIKIAKNHRVALRSGVQTCRPVPGWEWSLIHQGWPFGGDGFLTFHLDPLIQQNWSLVEWIPASPTMVISRWLLPGESSCVHGWSRREVAFDVCIELHFGHDSPGESGVGNAVKGEKQPNHLRFYYYTILVCCTSFLSLWLNDPYQGVSRNIDLP